MESTHVQFRSQKNQQVKQKEQLFEQLLLNNALPEGKSAYLVSIPDVLLLGNDKKILENPQVKRLMVQVLFYSGQLSHLRQNNWTNELEQWLSTKKNREAYRDYFENIILRQATEEYTESHVCKVLRGLP